MRVDDLPATPGTYVLVVECPEPVRLRAGALGETALEAGRFAYVGSAFGPGGVRARLGRHLRGSGRPKWHVDHLRAACLVCGAWWACGNRPREHLWAALLAAWEHAEPGPRGFGASDCACPTHLFRLLPGASLEAFSHLASERLPGDPAVQGWMDGGVPAPGRPRGRDRA